MTSIPWAASERATARPVMWQLNTRARGSGLDAVKGAVYIREDVRLVLDAHGHAQEAVGDPEPLAFLGRKAAMRRDRRVEHLGEEVPDRRGRGGELERVEEGEGCGVGGVAGGEGHDPAVETAGRKSTGVAKVASTARLAPLSRASRASAATSFTFRSGFAIASA